MDRVQDMFGYEYNELLSMLLVGVLIVVSIAGIAINSFLLRILTKMSEKSTSFVMIWSVAFADLLLCHFTLVICIVRPVLGYPEAYHSSFYCPALGSVTFFVSSMSGILMGFLAMERYSVICHQRGLPQSVVWTLFSAIALTFAILLIGNSIIGGFAPDPSFIFCMPMGTEWSLWANYTFNVLLNIPILVLTFCYIAIFVKCYRANVPDRAEQITKRVAIRSLLFLAIYLLCYLPKFTTTLIGSYYGLGAPPVLLYMLIPVGMTTLAIVNPILVLLLHRHVKGKVKEFIYRKKSNSMLLE
ncbi:hypothetical protein DSO57_1020356 [Entomophthora muscae]|uniref:Uncharacterized protein n=1 Tax=Entomophthora muscae TaxID=34485 RepID=A0ACC2SSJ3_9FUNG|nr:hypothetical protein DSO57_1020356 [Entomophthora muscae]